MRYKRYKLIRLEDNEMGGVDLVTEIDAGNIVRILTGKKERSIEFYSRLKYHCDEALLQMGIVKSNEDFG